MNSISSRLLLATWVLLSTTFSLAKADEPLTLDKVARAKDALRQTLTRITLSRQDIEETLWKGSFLFYDLKPFLPVAKELMDRFAIASTTLDSKPTSDLITMKLVQPMSLPEFTTVPVTTDATTALIDFKSTGPDSMIFYLRGFHMNGHNITAFEWKNPNTADLVLDDGTRQPFNVPFVVDFYKRHEADFKAMKDANDPAKRRPSTTAAGIYNFLYRFKTSDPSNILHISLTPNQIYGNEIRQWLISKADGPAMKQFANSIVQFFMNTSTGTIDLNGPQTINMPDSSLALQQRMTFQMFVEGTVNVMGMSANDHARDRWFQVTNFTLEPASERFTEGDLRMTVEVNPRNVVYKYYDLAKKSVEN